MFTALQATVDETAISAAGALLSLGGIAVTWLWLRVFYRSSGT